MVRYRTFQRRGPPEGLEELEAGQARERLGHRDVREVNEALVERLGERGRHGELFGEMPQLFFLSSKTKISMSEEKPEDLLKKQTRYDMRSSKNMVSKNAGQRSHHFDLKEIA